MDPSTSSHTVAPTMESVQSPSSPSSLPKGLLHQPASIDFRRRRSDERVFNPSAPSQGTSRSPETFQRNRLPEIGTLSTSVGVYSPFNYLSNIPHTNMQYHPFPPSQLMQSQSLGILQQAYVGDNTLPSPPLGTSEMPYTGIYSHVNWQQSTSLPQNSLGAYPQSQESIGLAPFDSFPHASTPGQTASLHCESVNESGPQVTSPPPNAVRGIELVGPRPAEGKATVQVRRDVLVILSFNKQMLSRGSATYDGLKIPSTPSVDKHEGESGKKLLHLQIRVLGATTKTPYETLCHSCKKRVGDKDAFPDFRAKSNILVPKKNGKLFVAFKLACCSKHREPRDSEYCLEVVLNGVSEQNTPFLRYRLPYSFSVVSKQPRNQAEDLDAVDAAVPPPFKLPKIATNYVSPVEGPVSQGAGPSGLDEHSSGDSRGPTNNTPSATSEPRAAADNHHSASPVEAPVSQGAGPSGLDELSSGGSRDPTNNTSSGTSETPAAVDNHRAASPPGAILAVAADNLNANAILTISDNRQSHNHQNERTVINQYASPPSSLSPLHPSPDFQRVLPPYISPPSTPLFLHTSFAPSVPPTRQELMTNLSANSPSDYSASAVLSPDIQPLSVNDSEEDVRRDLEAQPSFESIACGGLDGGAEEICVPETLNSGQAAVPQQLDVDTNHEPDEAAAVPAPQASLPLTSVLVELNPDNGTITLPAWLSLIRPQSKNKVIVIRRESQVALDINFKELLSLTGHRPVTQKSLVIPLTANVKTEDHYGEGDVVHLSVRVFGADTKSEYQAVCNKCSKREGKKRGEPSLVDFYAASNVIKASSDGLVQVKFKFCCYPNHQSPNESAYLLVVALSENQYQGQMVTSQRVVATCRLPWHFMIGKRQGGQDAPAAADVISPSRNGADSPFSDPLMNNWLTGLPNQPGSTSSLPAAPNFDQLHQLYTVLQLFYPDWCREHPFLSLVSGRSDAELCNLAVSWKESSGNYPMQLRASAPMIDATNQQPIMDYFGQATQQPLDFSAYGELNHGAQPFRAPGVQNREQEGAPHQLDVRPNYEPMGHGQASAVPTPQASLPLTAALVETHPDNGTTTLPAWFSFIRPQPRDQVIKVRRDCQVVLGIKFKGLSALLGPRPVTRKSLVIPSTASVRREEYSGEGDVVHLSVRVFGADTKSEYQSVCNKCSKREGKKKGKPSLVDFHAASNVIKASGDGLVQVKFKFCCYPNHQNSNDSTYLLEVALLEDQYQRQIVSSQKVVATCRLPWHFKVGNRQADQGPAGTSANGAVPSQINPGYPNIQQPMAVDTSTPRPCARNELVVPILIPSSPTSFSLSEEEHQGTSCVPTTDTQASVARSTGVSRAAGSRPRKRSRLEASLDDEDSYHTTGNRPTRGIASCGTTRRSTPTPNHSRSRPITTAEGITPHGVSSSDGSPASPSAPQPHLSSRPIQARAQAHQSTAQPTELVTTVLRAANPRCGPVSGGPEIWLEMEDIPTSFTLYAKFGDRVTATSVRNMCTLSCVLPSASRAGRVQVTLSRSAYPGAPQYGTSLAEFEYISDHALLIPILLRMEEKGHPEYTPTIRALVRMLEGDLAPQDSDNS